MNGHPDHEAEGEQRARTLRLALPHAVHRLNNLLAFVQGTCELEVHGPSRAPLLERLGVIVGTLKHLSLLAQAPEHRPVTVDLRVLFRNLELLLLPGDRGIDLRLVGSGAFLADGRLEERILGACLALAETRDVERPQRLAFRARTRTRTIRLWLVTEKAPAPGALAPLEDYARESGWSSTRHSMGEAFALGILVPLLNPPRSVLRPDRASTGHSALFLHEPGDVRELLTMVLLEFGHHVHVHEAEPERGEFTIALVQREKLDADPALAERLVARFGLGRVEAVYPRMRPEALLELLRPSR